MLQNSSRYKKKLKKKLYYNGTIITLVLIHVSGDNHQFTLELLK